MKWLMKLWVKLSGWKTIIAYILAQLPFLNDFPSLKDAIIKFFENPNDPTNIGNLIIQILLAIGVLHRVLKNIK